MLFVTEIWQEICSLIVSRSASPLLADRQGMAACILIGFVGICTQGAECILKSRQEVFSLQLILVKCKE